jgi:hypothetical protein
MGFGELAPPAFEEGKVVERTGLHGKPPALGREFERLLEQRPGLVELVYIHEVRSQHNPGRVPEDDDLALGVELEDALHELPLDAVPEEAPGDHEVCQGQGAN